MFLKSCRIASICLLLPLSQCCAAGILHAVLIADTNDGDVGLAVTQDLSTISSLILENVPTQQYKIISLSGDDVRRDKILSTITRLDMHSDDCLLVYFTGHGGFTPGKGYSYQLTPTVGGRREFLTREQIVRSIRSHDIRLGVLITDSCSSLPKNLAKSRSDSVARSITSYLDHPTPVFDSLFFKSKGFVDLASAKKGQSSAAISEQIGSAFTVGFANALRKHRQNRLDWRTATAMTRKETDRVLTAHKKRLGQKAILFSYPAITPTNKLRFGAVIGPTRDNSGVLVKQVDSGSIAANCGLNAGDIVQWFDGQRVRTYQELRPLLSESTGTSSLTILRKHQRLRLTIVWKSN